MPPVEPMPSFMFSSQSQPSSAPPAATPARSMSSTYQPSGTPSLHSGTQLQPQSPQPHPQQTQPQQPQQQSQQPQLTGAEWNSGLLAAADLPAPAIPLSLLLGGTSGNLAAHPGGALLSFLTIFSILAKRSSCRVELSVTAFLADQRAAARFCPHE